MRAGEVAVDPGADGCCRVFRCPVAGVKAVGDVATEPLGELDLLFGVAASPARTCVDAGAPQVVWAIEREEVDIAAPPAGGKVPEMVGDEGAKQYRGHPGLGDAVGDGEPRVQECGPDDRLAAAEGTRGIKKQVSVKGDAAAPQPAGKWREDGSLA